MGCKQSKYAIGDEGQGYMDPYKGDPNSMDDVYGDQHRPGGIQTDILPAHRYIGGGSNYQGSVQHSQQQMAQVPEPVNESMCPTDFQLAQMAAGCTSGFLEMFSLGGNQKMITNGPDQINAYHKPAYNYQTPPSSEQSLGNHSQNSQRRAILVQNGSYSL